jgi:hypothetical protein
MPIALDFADHNTLDPRYLAIHVQVIRSSMGSFRQNEESLKVHPRMGTLGKQMRFEALSHSS